MWGKGGLSFAATLAADSDNPEADFSQTVIDIKQTPVETHLDRTVVVDANAIVKGMRLETLGSAAITIREVLDEIRDRQSRQTLATLPFGIQIREPTEESMKEVKRFAALTGDLHSLSAPDLRIIALALTLEAEAVGNTDHLHKQPQTKQAVTRRGNARGGKALPGWGKVANPQDWTEVDNDTDPSLGATSGVMDGSSSRITSTVLDLSQTPVDEGEEHHEDMEEEEDQEEDEAPVARRPLGEEMEGVAGASTQDAAKGDEGEWEKPVSRSTKRKHKIRQFRQQAARGSEPPSEAAGGRGGGSEEQPGPAQGWGAEDDQEDEEEDEEEGETVTVDSKIVTVTSDFAMQNVILQMGLQLLTPDGVRITEVERWGFRCDACFFVTLQSGKHFCPQCGNGGTMKKVTVNVNSSGVVQFGVRKRHNLRGTRYSLPAPKSGRGVTNPVLREDQNLKTTSAGYIKRPMKKTDDDDFSCFEGAATNHSLSSSNKFDVVHKSNPNERRSTRANRRR